MPPRYTYWTIILEGKPTAFRASTQEELLPTLKQLQSRHPDAVMLWFARGKLWQSQEQAREAFHAARRRPEERRGPDWRPGGAHKDPRDRFKVSRDEKRRRFKERLYRDRGAPAERPGEPGPPRSPDAKRALPAGPASPREDRSSWKPARPPHDRVRAGGRPEDKGKGRFKPSGPARSWSRSGPPKGKPGGRKPGGGGRHGGGGGSSR
jgi:hypothetical protein